MILYHLEIIHLLHQSLTQFLREIKSLVALISSKIYRARTDFFLFDRISEAIYSYVNEISS